MLKTVDTMFSKKFSVTIPDPCHEDWDKMQNAKGGKFCQSCQKNVIDFSNKTEKEIYQILKNAKGQTCGRFKPSQLNTILVADAKPQWLHYLLKLKVHFITLFTLLASVPSKILYAKAHTHITSKEQQKIDQAAANLTDQIEKVVEGKVVDENNKAVKKVKVMIKVTYQGPFKEENYEVTTDSKGKFSIKLNLQYQAYQIAMHCSTQKHEGSYYLSNTSEPEEIVIRLQKLSDIPIPGGLMFKPHN